MSLPELFHHETLFVGVLGIRRMARLRKLQASDTNRSLPAGEGGLERLAEALLFSLEGAMDPGYDFALNTQALDYDSLGKCPALADDQRCSIHENRKPSVCSMVPFDALYPNRMQDSVLLSRQLGEECIVAGYREGYDVIFENSRITDAEYKKAIEKRRQDLIMDKEVWGKEVFSMFGPELFKHPLHRERIPFDGYLSIPLTPVLMVLASYSEHTRSRCAQYIRCQITLIDKKIGQALERKNNQDKPITKELRGIRAAYTQLYPMLLQDNFTTPTVNSRNNPTVSTADYLGI